VNFGDEKPRGENGRRLRLAELAGLTPIAGTRARGGKRRERWASDLVHRKTIRRVDWRFVRLEWAREFDDIEPVPGPGNGSSRIALRGSIKPIFGNIVTIGAGGDLGEAWTTNHRMDRRCYIHGLHSDFKNFGERYVYHALRQTAETERSGPASGKHLHNAELQHADSAAKTMVLQA